jgi:RIO-like serine/threonine protein kinase
VFANSTNTITDSNWKEQASMLLKEQETMFLSFRNILSKQQWKLLQAIAKEDKTFQPTSKTFIQKYDLSTSATIIKSLKILLNTELIFKDFDDEGNMYYSVYDVFFRRWCENRIN